MDKNRKILVSIFAFVLLSLLLSLFQIYFTMDKSKGSFQGYSSETRPGIGIVRLYGAISMIGEQTPFGAPSGAETVVNQLDDFGKDDSIKAILIRIDSPGGTVAATQEIYSKVMSVKKKNKIVVASMGDLAASGGYYVASACNYIMANHGTITASIGVIAASPNLKGLFEKLGIKMNVIKSGKYKDILSSSRDMTDDERILLQRMIDSSYLQFLKDVSLGRNIPIDDIRPFADGRVMDGDAALDAKLIDGIGTYEDALVKTKSLAGLHEDAPVYENKTSPLDQILGTVTGAVSAHPIQVLLKTQASLPIEYRYIP